MKKKTAKKNFKTLLCCTVLTVSLLTSLSGCGKSPSAKSADAANTENRELDQSETTASDLTEESVQNTGEDGVTGDMHNPAETSNGTKTTSVLAADFAVKLFQNSMDERQNTLISPLSVLSALAMTANGAKGDTLSQMEELFGVSLSELNPYLKSYLTSLPQGEKYKLHTANSIWVKKLDGFTVNDDFLQKTKDNFNAAVMEEPFDSSTLNKVNQWVELETDGMIDGILSEISEEDVVYLINALAFDAEWQNIYLESQIQDGFFTIEDGSRQEAEYMYSEEDKYLQDDNAQGFIKYYADEAYAFAALLPNEDTSIADYAASLTGGRLYSILSNAQDTTVNAAIPKFESEYSVNMKQILQQLGMVNAFDPEYSDFSGIGISKDGPLFISEVIHKSCLKLDEKGTKAGAATAVIMAQESAYIPLEEPKTVYLDRPFVYMIIDCEENLPVFMGAVMTMD